jgi:hypothetical protein
MKKKNEQKRNNCPSGGMGKMAAAEELNSICIWNDLKI